MTPLRPWVYALMLSLRRRWLERQLAEQFDVALSRQLDAVIQEQETLTEKGGEM
jgi:hypothetical protein